MTGYTVKFQNLTNARSFADRAVKPMFIFNAPDSGYLVCDARAAKQLFADGHQDIR